MPNIKLHKILERQIRKSYGRTLPNLNKFERVLLEKVNETYKHADKENETLKESLKLMSKEMQGNNDKLAKENKKLSESVIHIEELEHMKSAMLNIMEDLNKEKLQSEDLLIETMKFKEVVENMTSGVMMTAPDTNIIMYVNQAMADITRYSKEEMIGKSSDLFKSKDARAGLYDEISTAMKQGQSFSSDDFVNIRKSGEVYKVSGSIYPISRDKNKIFYVHIYIDITARLQSEKARTEFVSIAGHQLRTPLSATRWFLEDLLDNPEGMSMTQMETVSGLYKTTLRMINLVNDMLDTSRLEVGTMLQEKEALNIVSVIKEVMKEQEINAEKQNVAVTIDLSQENSVKSIISDKKLLRMVIENILSNAIKYTPPGGKVVVSLENIQNIFKEKEFNQPGVIIAIADTGIGIPEHQVGRMFEKMFRADNARSIEAVGTGLGLYTVKLIVDEVGGEIWFDTKTGEGTTFFVYLPYGTMDETNSQNKE